MNLNFLCRCCKSRIIKKKNPEFIESAGLHETAYKMEWIKFKEDNSELPVIEREWENINDIPEVGETYILKIGEPFDEEIGAIFTNLFEPWQMAVNGWDCAESQEDIYKAAAVLCRFVDVIQSKVKRLLFQYGDFPEEDTILEDLNIIKNPGHVYIKGSAVIFIKGQRLDLAELNGDIAISLMLLPEISSINVTGSRVMTIENLTTFNAFHEKDTFAVYLGGYHNSHRRSFIKKIYQDNPHSEYYHFGDIDAGGFYILLHLRAKTGVHFMPYHMGIPELQKFKAYTKPLTDNDKKRLAALNDSEFSETVNYMLENDCKLEQEALDMV